MFAWLYFPLLSCFACYFSILLLLLLFLLPLCHLCILAFFLLFCFYMCHCHPTLALFLHSQASHCGSKRWQHALKRYHSMPEQKKKGCMWVMSVSRQQHFSRPSCLKVINCFANFQLCFWREWRETETVNGVNNNTRLMNKHLRMLSLFRQI